MVLIELAHLPVFWFYLHFKHFFVWLRDICDQEVTENDVQNHNVEQPCKPNHANEKIREIRMVLPYLWWVKVLKIGFFNIADWIPKNPSCIGPNCILEFTFFLVNDVNTQNFVECCLNKDHTEEEDNELLYLEQCLIIELNHGSKGHRDLHKVHSFLHANERQEPIEDWV